MYGLSFFVILTARGLVHTGQGNICFSLKRAIANFSALRRAASVSAAIV